MTGTLFVIVKTGIAGLRCPRVDDQTDRSVCYESALEIQKTQLAISFHHRRRYYQKPEEPSIA